MPADPFHFSSSVNLSLVTSRRARDLAELVGHLREVPGAAIYYHTHHFLVQHQYLRRSRPTTSPTGSRRCCRKIVSVSSSPPSTSCSFAA
jgi:hypothetical protein